MTEDQAATVALEALAHVIASGPPLDRFLGLSGMDAASLADRANEPDFLVSVLDFILSDDALMADFCTAHDMRAVHLARNVLAGGVAQ